MLNLVDNACLWWKKLNFFFFMSLFSGIAQSPCTRPQWAVCHQYKSNTTIDMLHAKVIQFSREVPPPFCAALEYMWLQVLSIWDQWHGLPAVLPTRDCQPWDVMILLSWGQQRSFLKRMVLLSHVQLGHFPVPVTAGSAGELWLTPQRHTEDRQAKSDLGAIFGSRHGPPLPPRFFVFKMMQFSGNFKGKAPVLSKFWAQDPCQNSAGPPCQTCLSCESPHCVWILVYPSLFFPQNASSLPHVTWNLKTRDLGTQDSNWAGTTVVKSVKESRFFEITRNQPLCVCDIANQTPPLYPVEIKPKSTESAR